MRKLVDFKIEYTNVCSHIIHTQYIQAYDVGEAEKLFKEQYPDVINYYFVF